MKNYDIENLAIENLGCILYTLHVFIYIKQVGTFACNLMVHTIHVHLSYKCIVWHLQLGDNDDNNNGCFSMTTHVVNSSIFSVEIPACKSLAKPTDYHLHCNYLGHNT